MGMLEQTRTWLANADLDQVSTATGVGVRYLYKIKTGEISNPGIKNVEPVFKYLSALQDQVSTPSSSVG